MCGIQTKYLCIIIGIICVSGTRCIALTGGQNVTVDATTKTVRLAVTAAVPLINQTQPSDETHCSESHDVIEQSVEIITENVTYVENNTSCVRNVMLETYDDYEVRKTAGFVAIGFLGFAVAGYTGFVLWRRYLQNKYGNGQNLITEDVYDTADLRYFEI